MHEGRKIAGRCLIADVLQGALVAGRRDCDFGGSDSARGDRQKSAAARLLYRLFSNREM
jgi:hypothetical protein